MNIIKKSINKSPINWFFILTFAFSWGVWLLIPFLHTLGLLAPTFAAIIVTGIMKGKPGIIALLKRLAYWRVALPWYLFVLFSTAVIGFLAIGLYVLTGGTAPAISFYIFLPGIITYGLTEEIGWRGFALPELQKKYSALTSSVIIGVIWAFWHFIITPGSPLFIMVFSLEVVILSILFTWVYNNTNGSILLVALYHTVINIVISNLKIPTIPRLWVIYLLLDLVLVLIIIWRFGPRHLSISKKFAWHQD